MTKLQRLQLESVLQELEIELIRVEHEMDEVRLLLKSEARRDRVVRRTDRRCSRQIQRRTLVLVGPNEDSDS
jgi:hypothetical protein